jgi:hypothetical protein
MPFVLVISGLILVVTGVRNTYADLGAQLLKDFTGPQSFLMWALAIGAVGALGYVSELRSLSHWFLALIIISIFLSKQGFFQKFQQQISAIPAQPASAPQQTSANTPTAPSMASLASSGIQFAELAALAG